MLGRLGLLGLLAVLANQPSPIAAISLDITSESSILNAAKIVEANTWGYYTGYRPGDNPGNLPKLTTLAPYYWWSAGGLMSHMMTYSAYTGDHTWDWAVRQAVTWNAGSTGIFMPANQSADEGNDDQVFWGFTAMLAAELNFDPPQQNESVPSYVGMAQAVAKSINDRWDDTKCGGGLRWQLTPLSGSGYTYKNAVANGGLFMLAARLARYTGNDSYVDLATKEWNWISSSKLYDPATFQINDGMDMSNNCSDANQAQWSYNYSIIMTGLAFLYNYTNDAKWRTPLQGITKKFFSVFAPKNNVLSEVTCEPSGNCDNDQLSFKSYDMQWLVVIMQLVPAMKDTITPYYKASAQGAAGQCDGAGNHCGYDWSSTTFTSGNANPGPNNIGMDMSALAAMYGSLYFVKDLPVPITVKTGGSSQPNDNIGQTKDPLDDPNSILNRPITTGDRAGAGILTALVLALTLGGTYWLLTAAS